MSVAALSLQDFELFPLVLYAPVVDNSDTGHHLGWSQYDTAGNATFLSGATATPIIDTAVGAAHNRGVYGWRFTVPALRKYEGRMCIAELVSFDTGACTGTQRDANSNLWPPSVSALITGRQAWTKSYPLFSYVSVLLDMDGSAGVRGTDTRTGGGAREVATLIPTQVDLAYVAGPGSTTDTAVAGTVTGYSLHSSSLGNAPLATKLTMQGVGSSGTLSLTCVNNVTTPSGTPFKTYPEYARSPFYLDNVLYNDVNTAPLPLNVLLDMDDPTWVKACFNLYIARSRDWSGAN